MKCHHGRVFGTRITSRSERIGTVGLLARYPVKSMQGETLIEATVGPRGFAGDRSWAVYTTDGGIGSGKTTRRFRRVDGLLMFNSWIDETGAVVEFPDGTRHRVDDPVTASQLSEALGQPLELRTESSVAHHDECPVHLVTTAAVHRLEQLRGESIDTRRFRANIVLEVEGSTFAEDAWEGRKLILGEEVILQLGDGMPRCVMVGLPQLELGRDRRLPELIARYHYNELGLQADVLRGGTVHQGDVAYLI
jgi:uncharacterized protein YcbX